MSVLVMAPGTASGSSAPTPVWAQQSPAASPLARDEAAPAFDSGTGQFVLASGRDRLRATTGLHTLTVIVSHRVRVTEGHHIKTVTVTQTITAKLHIC